MIEQPCGEDVCRQTKITVYHTLDGEEVWDISFEDDI